jgi:tetratricopeptide (TPR) repeat protein
MTLGVASGASAQCTDAPNVCEAREHLNLGSSMLEQQNYDGALAEFERAYDIVGAHPFRYLILFNIARAHELRFRYDLALQYYQRYLDEGPPDAEHRAEVQATMRTLEGMLATVHIDSNVGAEVWIDDRHVGDAPGDVRTTSGRHVVVLRARGYQDSMQELQIAARETRNMTFELVEGGNYRGLSSVYFISMSSLAVVTALVGGGFGIAALMRYNDANGIAMDEDDPRHFDGGMLQAAQDEINTYALVADVLYGTAGALAITAIVLAFMTDFGGGEASAEAEASASVVPVVGPSFAGLALEGGF